jgi:hypothetical protein
MKARQVDCPVGIVSRCPQAGQAMSCWYVLFTSPIAKSVPQPVAEMARPVLFCTITRAGMVDPSVIVCDGSTSCADSGAEGRPDAAEMWLPPEHPAANSASATMNFLTSL